MICRNWKWTKFASSSKERRSTEALRSALSSYPILEERETRHDLLFTCMRICEIEVFYLLIVFISVLFLFHSLVVFHPEPESDSTESSEDSEDSEDDVVIVGPSKSTQKKL